MKRAGLAALLDASSERIEVTLKTNTNTRVKKPKINKQNVSYDIGTKNEIIKIAKIDLHI